MLGRARTRRLTGRPATHALEPRLGQRVRVTEETAGDEAGIKSASLTIEGDFAYGTLRSNPNPHPHPNPSPDPNPKQDQGSTVQAQVAHMRTQTQT